VIWDNETMLDVEGLYIASRFIICDPPFNKSTLWASICFGQAFELEAFFPAQLKKKIGAINWSLLPVQYKTVDTEVKEGTHEKCIFYFIENLPLLVELMISCSKMDKSFTDSSEISNFKNTHLFFRGIDRGGDDLIDMLHYGNCLDGNSGKYCIPTSVLEKGSEKYSNLAATTFEKHET
jgi:hypothetical protein